MVLSLLCLIGLRHNQIERDNCVPVTFPLRQAERGGRGGLREGQGLCVHAGVGVQYVMCANVCVWLGKRELPRHLHAVAPRCARHQGHRATGPQGEAWCPYNRQRETSPGERVCVCVCL